MNYRLHHTLIDFINILLQFIIAYLLISILQHFIDPASALHALSLLPAPFISYEIKENTKHFWSFMLLHILLIAVYALLVNNLFIKALYLLYLVYLTIVTYYTKHKVYQQKNTTIFYIIFIFIMYLGCGPLHMQDMLTLCFILGIVYTMLFLCNMYLLNLSRFVREHSDVKNMPYQQIRNSNNVLVTFLSGLFLLAMLIFSRLPMGNALVGLGKLIGRLITYLFSLIHFKQSGQMIEEEAPVQEDVPVELPAQDPSYLIELLSKILEWIAIIIAIACIVALLLYAIYRIYKYFYLKGREEEIDQVEFISPFIKSERIKRAQRQIHSTITGHTNNAMIRKYFFKAVSSRIGSRSGLSKSMTPAELSTYAIGKTESKETAAPEKEELRQLLTTYYEKARYGKEECSKEEVQIVKNILKQDK